MPLNKYLYILLFVVCFIFPAHCKWKTQFVMQLLQYFSSDLCALLSIFISREQCLSIYHCTECNSSSDSMQLWCALSRCLLNRINPHAILKQMRSICVLFCCLLHFLPGCIIHSFISPLILLQFFCNLAARIFEDHFHIHVLFSLTVLIRNFVYIFFFLDRILHTALFDGVCAMS